MKKQNQKQEVAVMFSSFVYKEEAYAEADVTAAAGKTRHRKSNVLARKLRRKVLTVKQKKAIII